MSAIVDVKDVGLLTQKDDCYCNQYHQDMMVSQEGYQPLNADGEPYVRHGRNGLPAVWMIDIGDGRACSSGPVAVESVRVWNAAVFSCLSVERMLVVRCAAAGMCRDMWYWFMRSECSVEFGFEVRQLRGRVFGQLVRRTMRLWKLSCGRREA